jgi:hypothetical protein
MKPGKKCIYVVLFLLILATRLRQYACEMEDPKVKGIPENVHPDIHGLRDWSSILED